MPSIKNLSILVLLAGLLGACNSKQSPGYEYMPDMYRSPHIKAYEANHLFQDSLSALVPVEGTIPRGFSTYKKYPNTPEGYEMAKAEMMAPDDLLSDEMTLEESAKLYGIFCAQCHGAAGDGNGVLVQNEKFVGVPSYADREITAGSIFHVITYGKGVMGSHAAQVTPEERWKIAMHVLKLKAELSGGTEEAQSTEPTDTVVEVAMNNNN